MEYIDGERVIRHKYLGNSLSIYKLVDDSESMYLVNGKEVVALFTTFRMERSPDRLAVVEIEKGMELSTSAEILEDIFYPSETKPPLTDLSEHTWDIQIDMPGPNLDQAMRFAMDQALEKLPEGKRLRMLRLDGIVGYYAEALECWEYKFTALKN